MLWIYCRKGESIPEDLKYPGWQTDRDDDEETPLMFWVRCREGEPIPEDMYYPGWEADRDKMK